MSGSLGKMVINDHRHRSVPVDLSVTCCTTMLDTRKVTMLRAELAKMPVTWDNIMFFAPCILYSLVGMFHQIFVLNLLLAFHCTASATFGDI